LLHVRAAPDWQPKTYQERSLELNIPTLAWLKQARAGERSQLSPYVYPARQGPKPGSRIGGMLVTRLTPQAKPSQRYHAAGAIEVAAHGETGP